MSQSREAGSPFVMMANDRPLVAIPGDRNGYIMLAPAQELTRYSDLPEGIFQAARAWCATLEAMGSPRAYWITLSEVTPHLHIHLFPRWPEDTLLGIPLFESRNDLKQPPWIEELRHALQKWADTYAVTLPQPAP